MPASIRLPVPFSPQHAPQQPSQPDAQGPEKEQPPPFRHAALGCFVKRPKPFSPLKENKQGATEAQKLRGQQKEEGMQPSVLGALMTQLAEVKDDTPTEV